MNQAITVTLTGKKQKDVGDALIHLKTEHQVNQVPFAELTMVTGNFPNTDYPLFSEDDYKIGKELAISIRYEGQKEIDHKIFKGIITQRAFESVEEVPAIKLKVEDPSFRLKNQAGVYFYQKKNGLEIIKKRLNDCKGLSVGKTNSRLNQPKYEQKISLNQTAWEEIGMTLQSCGLVMAWQDGKLSVLDYSDTSSTYKLTIDQDEIVDISLNQKANHLSKEAQVSYWDPKNNKIKEKKEKSIPLASDVDAPKMETNTLDLTEIAEAEHALQSFLLQQKMMAWEGGVTVIGDASVNLMQSLQLLKVPKGYEEKIPITKVTHYIEKGVWYTQIGVGMQSEDFFEEKSTEFDMQLGEVQSLQKDPQGLGRIPIKIAAFGKETFWAFLGQLSAGSSQSYFRIPQKGETVCVAFLHGSLSQGIILTSSYLGNKNPPSPFKLSSDTPMGFLSEGKLQILFEDKKHSIKMHTPDNHQVILGKSEGVKVESKGGIDLNSSKKMSLKASGGNIDLKGRSINLN